MTNKEILETIIKNEGITYAELARKMGLKGQPTQLYDIRDGKIKSITQKTAEKIVSAFPNYNRVWLLTGEGSPFIDEQKENYPESKICKNKDDPATMKQNSDIVLSDLAKRFLKEVERLNISFYEIANKTGVKIQMFTKIKRGIQEPSLKFLNTFCNSYPDANKIYIITGEKLGLNNDRADMDDLPNEKRTHIKRNANPPTIDILYLLDIMNQVMDELDTIKSQNRSLMKEILELKASVNKEKEIG